MYPRILRAALEKTPSLASRYDSGLRAVILNHPLYTTMSPSAKRVVRAFRDMGLKIGNTTGFMSGYSKWNHRLEDIECFAPDVSHGLPRDLEEHLTNSICLPSPFWNTMRDLGGHLPSQVAMVDSCPVRLLGASRAGCWTIAVPHGDKGMDWLVNAKCAHYTVSLLDQAPIVVTHIDEKIQNRSL
jgi:beta-phosphoglucomutase-like phosphatase (HAD superfamily)